MKIHNVSPDVDLAELEDGEVFQFEHKFYMIIDRHSDDNETKGCVHLSSGEVRWLSKYASVLHKPKARLLTEG